MPLARASGRRPPVLLLPGITGEPARVRGPELLDLLVQRDPRDRRRRQGALDDRRHRATEDGQEDLHAIGSQLHAVEEVVVAAGEHAQLPVLELIAALAFALPRDDGRPPLGAGGMLEGVRGSLALQGVSHTSSLGARADARGAPPRRLPDLEGSTAETARSTIECTPPASRPGRLSPVPCHGTVISLS